MTKKITLASTETCTGCGACANICPKDAIKMYPDKEGFIQPQINIDTCIGCGKCEKACPVLHPQYDNRDIDFCYAVWANDELREKTSTAGYFLLAARYFLQNGGIVYGAAWTDSWYVHHTRVENLEEIEKLTGSKYLQSDAENCYRLISNDLKNGKKVLFSGCPCLVAGLYGFLGKRKVENLITMELICHGVPSPQAFHKYLTDNFDIKNISKISFRDKTYYGWRSTQNIYFSDGTIYRQDEKNDPFYKAFLSCMIVRRSCSVCAFSKLPRQADITIGDFWGIDATAKEWNDKKGTGVVLINSTNGEQLWNILTPSLSKYQRFPLGTAARINRTILQPFRQNPGRKHFFLSMDLKPFNQMVEDSLNHHYDIGIVGLWYGINYGSILTYYALYHLMRDMGLDPVMLPKPNNLWEERFNSPSTIAQKFILRRCNVFNPCRTLGEYPRMNDRCDGFIVGSDVVWDYGVCGKQSDQFFFLDWVESKHKKIAYAASFGSGLHGAESYKKKAQYYLKKFDAISIREKAGVEIAKGKCGRDDIVQVLDPVFVCNPSIYEETIQESKLKIDEPIIFAYTLNRDLSDLKKKLIDMACQYYGGKAYICGNPNELELSKKCYGDRVLPLISVEQWLYYMKNCSCYIGDSYHSLCFSLIFHRPFIIVYRKTNQKSSIERFYSLLELVGLKDRIIETEESLEKYHELFDKKIDWERVDNILGELKKESIQWLKSALNLPLRHTTAEDFIEDSYKRKLAEIDVKLYELNERLQKYSSKNNNVSKESISTPITQSDQDLSAIYLSNSWKIGRAITWLPRKIKQITTTDKI